MLKENKEIVEIVEKKLPHVNLEKVIQKNDYAKGQLFANDNQATYTFMHSDEVVVLHLDLRKQDLFFKGHKVTSLDMHKDLRVFLERFYQTLLDQKVADGFICLYEDLVAKLDPNP